MTSQQNSSFNEFSPTINGREIDSREKQILIQDQSHIWHPYTQHQGMPLPLPIARAEGEWLYDHNDTPIFDAVSSWWVTTHGHCNSVIAEAIASQARTLDHVIFAGCTHEPATELAAALSARLPRGLNRVFFSDNGSTAVEAAIKISLQSYTNTGKPRKLIAALDNAYHGDTFGAMSASGRGIFTTPFDSLLFEVERLPDPSVGDTIAALEELLDGKAEELAAVIVEPLLLGASGMRVWDERVLQKIRSLTQEAGVHLIADEVLTGFGRTGPLWACDRADIRPDIICLSKGITGGFLPLGATVTTEKIFDTFLGDRSRTLFHGHSYTANPIACAAALASLNLLDERSEDARISIEVSQANSIQELKGHKLVKAVRQLGTIAAIELKSSGGYLNPSGHDVASLAIQENILLRPLGNVIYVLPPYCSSDESITATWNVVKRFLDGERSIQAD